MVHQFWSDSFIAFLGKEKGFYSMSAYFSETSNVKHRAVIKFFTLKGPNATEINKELDNIYRDSAPWYGTIVKWMAEFMESERGFEDALWGGCPSTTTADESAEAVEPDVKNNRQVSVRRVADELSISKTRVREIISQH